MAAQISTAYLNAIETAVPEHDVHTKFVSYVPSLAGDERIKRVFQRLANKSGIEHRYSIIKPSEHLEVLDRDGVYRRGSFATTRERMQIFEREALKLAITPVERMLSRVPASEITHLIYTTCTGFSAPGPDLQLRKHFGLRNDLERTVIGFMGCFAAFNAMKAARHIVRSESKSKVLLVNLELCTLHLQESADPEQLLAFLQFADGCAVSLVSAEPFGLSLDRFRTDVLSDEEELIQWHIGDRGFEMVLSPDVPQALGRGVPRVLENVMSKKERSDLSIWAVHPGGRSILDAFQEKAGLPEGSLDHSREVLRNFGNMSSATILFVLKSILEDQSTWGKGAAFAFGPGLTVESLMFEKVRA